MLKLLSDSNRLQQIKHIFFVEYIRTFNTISIINLKAVYNGIGSSIGYANPLLTTMNHNANKALLAERVQIILTRDKTIKITITI